jgi:hypothetical protein
MKGKIFNAQTRGAKVIMKCKCCKTEFEARVADVKRGWGKFCSKSCKAKKQESITGQYKNYQNRFYNDREVLTDSGGQIYNG